jgi:hypothetical protein
MAYFKMLAPQFDVHRGGELRGGGGLFMGLPEIFGKIRKKKLVKFI